LTGLSAYADGEQNKTKSIKNDIFLFIS